MKAVIKPVRNSEETLSTQNLITSRNFQCWPKFSVSHEEITYVILEISGNTIELRQRLPLLKK